jgi:4-amino-4-deoxychorismate lyase
MLKIRVLLSKEGDLRTEVGPLDDLPFDLMSRAYFNPDKEVPSHPGYIITAYLDTEATSSSPFTSIKTTHRPHYDAARKRAEIASFKELKEVILFNEKDEITEASTYSVAFWRDGKWVTPPLDSGCLAGTARAWMLEHGLIAEKVVPRESLQDEEWVLLSNGAKGVQLGKVSLDLVRNKT